MLPKWIKSRLMKLDEIEARLNAATPGPWKWEIDASDGTNALVSSDESVIGRAVLWGQDKNDYGAHIRVTEEDAEFMAHVRSDMEYLMAEIKKLKG